MFNMAKWRRTESKREREKDIQRIRDGECGGKRGRRKRAGECFTLSNNSQSAIAQFNEFTFDDFR